MDIQRWMVGATEGMVDTTIIGLQVIEGCNSYIRACPIVKRHLAKGIFETYVRVEMARELEKTNKKIDTGSQKTDEMVAKSQIEI